MFPRCSLVALVALAVNANLHAQPKPPKQGGSTETTWTCGKWIIRTERIPIQTPRPLGLSYNKYYIRSADGGDEWHAYGDETQRGELLTVLDDATLAVWSSSSLYWIPRKGKPRLEVLKIDTHKVAVARAWPDGMIIRPSWLNKPAPYYFAPIKGKGDKAMLDLAAMVPLTGDAHTYDHDGQFTRNRDQLVWLTDAVYRKTTSVCVFDLKTSKRRSFPFQHESCNVHSFDGQYAVISHNNAWTLFDTMRGNPVGRSHTAGPLTQRDGFAYYLFHETIDPKDVRGLSYLHCRLSVLDMRAEQPAEKILWQEKFYSGYPKHEILKEGVRITHDKMTRVIAWEVRNKK